MFVVIALWIVGLLWYRKYMPAWVNGKTSTSFEVSPPPGKKKCFHINVFVLGISECDTKLHATISNYVVQWLEQFAAKQDSCKESLMTKDF